MELSIIIGSLVANIITKYAKPNKDALTYEQMANRKAIIRMLNAGVGMVVMVATYALIGDGFDVQNFTELAQVFIAGAVTFVGSQGFYHLAK